jgi:hypothetical protein
LFHSHSKEEKYEFQILGNNSKTRIFVFERREEKPSTYRALANHCQCAAPSTVFTSALTWFRRRCAEGGVARRG